MTVHHDSALTTKIGNQSMYFHRTFTVFSSKFNFQKETIYGSKLKCLLATYLSKHPKYR